MITALGLIVTGVNEYVTYNQLQSEQCEAKSSDSFETKERIKHIFTTKTLKGINFITCVHSNPCKSRPFIHYGIIIEYIIDGNWQTR